MTCVQNMMTVFLNMIVIATTDYIPSTEYIIIILEFSELYIHLQSIYVL